MSGGSCDPWTRGGFLYLCDGAHGFGAALPEHQFVLAVQVLWSLDETEMNGGLVACPQAVFAHAQDGRRLSDAAAVDCRRRDGVRGENRLSLPLGFRFR